MATGKPDSGYSWAIVLCCAYIHFALFGLFRSAGVMYVALLQNFDVTREEASWPFSLCSAVFQLIGPAASVLTYFMSQRAACLLGSAIATIGVSSCYFAESLLWINIFYGVVHGLGFGLVVTLVPVILNQYFVKHRATAIGIAFSGGTISSFVFPVAMEWMLENYSLKGSYLLLGGIVMNTLVASSLLRTPPWLKKPKKTKPKLLEDYSEAKDSGVSTTPEANSEFKSFKNSVSCSPFKNEDSAHFQRDDSIEKENSSAIDKMETEHLTNSALAESKNLDTVYSNNDSVLFGGSNSKINELSISTGNKYDNIKHESFNEKDVEVQEPLMSGRQIFVVPKQNEIKLRDKKKRKVKCVIFPHSIMDVLKQPMFHLITFTMCIYFLGIHSFFMVIVDFAKDKGIPESKGIYIFSVFSLTDLVGRAGFGWITDRNYINRKSMVILNLAVIGVVNQFYPIVDALSGIMVVAAFHGLAVGSSITLFFVLQAEYLGMKRLTLVVGLTSFVNGCLTLLRPAMIGLFRDVIGSYNWMFHFLGAISLAFSVIWLLETFMTKNKKIPIHEQDGKV